MEQKLNALLRDLFGKTLETAQSAEVYDALMQLTLQEMGDRPRLAGDKKLYYVSAEFLIGKLLSCNLISLGMFEEAKATLARHGLDLAKIEE